MNLQRWLQVPGVRFGALVHGVVFVCLAAGWYALEPRSGGTRTADTGAMDMLAPVVFLLTASVVVALAASSSVLGAFAGYWAARTGSPVVGALAGLAAGAVAAGVLAVLFPGAAAGVGAAWVAKLKWLVPPAVVAGIVVGVIDRDRP